MKIYFTASTAKFKQFEKNYFAIRDFLVAEGHTLTRDWLPKTKAKIDRKEMNIPDIKEIYKANMKAIQDADLVIIEDTVSNFSTGHQITVALQRQKPTLVLWCEPKHRHFKQTFIQGIESEHLQVSEYNLRSFKPVLRQFINRYQNFHSRNRFHLVLNETEREYLDWAGFTQGKSRTKIIRKFIAEGIQTDNQYQKYLAGENTLDLNL